MGEKRGIVTLARRLVKGGHMGKSLSGEELGKGITQRKDGIYQGSFVAKDGRRVALYSRNLDDVKRKLKERKEKNNACITLDKWFEVWLAVYEAHVRDSTKRTYEVQYGAVKEKLGKRDICEIKHIDIQNAINELKTVSHKTHVRALLFNMFKTAALSGIIEKNPVVGIKVLGNSVKNEKRVLSKEEVDLLLEYTKSTAYLRDITIVALGTGLRIGEILALRVEDLDFRKRLIQVRGTILYLPGEGSMRHDPKSVSSRREVPMIESVEQALRRRINLVEEGLIFQSANGTPLNDGNIRKQYRHFFEKIEEDHPDISYEGVTPHTFRHTFATNCIELGMTPKVLQKILGHGSLQITMDLYCHVRTNTLVSEMERCCSHVV